MPDFDTVAPSHVLRLDDQGTRNTLNTHTVYHAATRVVVVERSWTLTYAVLTETEYASLVSLFETLDGPSLTADFTPPGEATVKAAFMKNALSALKATGAANALAFDIIEVP